MLPESRVKAGAVARVSSGMRVATACLVVLLGFGAFGRSAHAWHITPAAQPAPSPATPLPMDEPAPPEVPLDPLAEAARRASPGGRRVLESARAMLASETVVRGSCYTWAREVYRRAGGRSRAVFAAGRGERWASPSRLQPGDWVSFINHSFNNVTHAAIFVGWVDERARVAMTVSYPGQNRDAPGRMGEYELTHVYRIVRMDDRPAAPPARARERRSARP